MPVAKSRSRGVWVPPLLLLFSLFRPSPVGFGVGKQENLRLLRERDGLVKTSKARNPNVTLSEDGRDMLARIGDARERGDWQNVKALFRKYAGAELPVFHAVLHAAHNCGQYEEGTSLYEKLCSLKIEQDAPTYATAMKMYAKLGNASRVREIWSVARKGCRLDPPLAAARIDAAAAEGDVLTAAELLDEMNRTGVEIDIAHVTSAIRACWEAEGSSHNAAKCLFEFGLDLDLQPNVITFACLMGAYAAAPLKEVLSAYVQMGRMGVKPNKAFAEVYLTTVLQISKEEWVPLRKVEDMAARIQERSLDRREAATAALASRLRGLVSPP